MAEQGTVKWFSAGKHYGFVQPDDGGEDVMLHDRDLSAGTAPELLQPGVRVSFDLRRTPKGLRAVNVELCRPRAQPAGCGFRDEVAAVLADATDAIDEIARRYGMAG